MSRFGLSFVIDEEGKVVYGRRQGCQGGPLGTPHQQLVREANLSDRSIIAGGVYCRKFGLRWTCGVYNCGNARLAKIYEKLCEAGQNTDGKDRRSLNSDLLPLASAHLVKVLEKALDMDPDGPVEPPHVLSPDCLKELAKESKAFRNRLGRTFLVDTGGYVHWGKYMGVDDDGKAAHEELCDTAFGGDQKKVVAGGSVKLTESGKFDVEWSSGYCNLSKAVKEEVNKDVRLFDEKTKRTKNEWRELDDRSLKLTANVEILEHTKSWSEAYNRSAPLSPSSLSAVTAAALNLRKKLVTDFPEYAEAMEKVHPEAVS